jgi:hypothetical protein
MSKSVYKPLEAKNTATTEYEEMFLKMRPDQQEAINSMAIPIMAAVKGTGAAISFSHGAALELLCKLRDFTC